MYKQSCMHMRFANVVAEAVHHPMNDCWCGEAGMQNIARRSERMACNPRSLRLDLLSHNVFRSWDTDQ